MNFHDTLMKKAHSQSLAHFYIVEATGTQEDTSTSLQASIHNFIRNYYQKIENYKGSMTNLMDHPDVFVLGNLAETSEAAANSFTVLESEALARFFEFKAVQSKRKFAVITEAHRITPLVANKWLKLFEEPQGESTIFLLNPRRQKLLDTIHSRAIHLRLPLERVDEDYIEWNDFLIDVKKLTLSAFLDKFIKGNRELKFWVNELIRWESRETDQAASKEALSMWLKNYQEMELFHQPAATKWSLFYSYLQEHVLPRHKAP